MTGNELVGRTMTPHSSCKDMKHWQEVKNHGDAEWGDGAVGSGGPARLSPEQNLQNGSIFFTARDLNCPLF